MTRMYPGRDLISVCKKIFIGQTTVGPLFTAIFYSLNAALQGEGQWTYTGIVGTLLLQLMKVLHLVMLERLMLCKADLVSRGSRKTIFSALIG